MSWGERGCNGLGLCERWGWGRGVGAGCGARGDGTGRLRGVRAGGGGEGSVERGVERGRWAAQRWRDMKGMCFGCELHVFRV